MFLRHQIVVTFLFVTVFIFFFVNIFDSKISEKTNSQLNQNTKKSEVVQTKPLTLEGIFNDNSRIDHIPSDEKIVLIATGDVIPARVVNINATKFNNFKWPFEKTAEVLSSADVTFINLETPLIANCPLVNYGFKFCGSEKNIEGLLFAGVDVASLANNHAGNYGIEGINYTAKLLRDNGIIVTGQGKPVYKDVKNMKIAFLGYNDIEYEQEGISWANELKITADISEARKNSDFVIVAYHWGVEYRDQPDDRQKYLAHFTIDAGADLIIGNHPHWIQPIEFYKGKLITYAHGNFVFDQEWSKKTKQGVVGKYIFYDKKLIDVEFMPVFIVNYGQPYFLENIEKQKILDHMEEQSKILMTTQK